MLTYNSTFDSNSNNNVEFININLPCNKLSIQLLANDSMTYTKKKYVVEIEDKANEPPKSKPTPEKRVPIKQVGKKSSKVSVPIYSFIGKASLDIQTFLIKINIVILELQFFQISPKF